MSLINLQKGLFIAIEGIDGAGKSTQIRKLCEWFENQGLETVALREPTDGPYGQQIREVAKKQRHLFKPEDELELFIQDRIEDCEKNIQPALDRKAMVFIDRYFYSNIAYQGALGLDPQMIRGKNEAIAILPDLVFVLDIPVQSGLHRIQTYRKDKPDDFENVHYLEKVRALFLAMQDPQMIQIDATRKAEEVFEDIRNHILGLIKTTLGSKI